MAIEPPCPACKSARGRVYRVTTVPGRKDIIVVNLSCGSCWDQWRRELQTLFIGDSLRTALSR